MDIAELRRKVLDANDIATKKVHVAEWDVDLWLRTLTGKERDIMEAQWRRRKKMEGGDDDAEFRRFVVCWCTVDESGKQVFDTHGDVAALGKKSAMAIVKVFGVANELNAFTDSKIEELAGNCETGPRAGSTSDSPSPSE